MNIALRILCFIVMLAVFAFRVSAEDFINAIAAYLQHYVHAQLPHGCMVVGLVDEHGSSVLSTGVRASGGLWRADLWGSREGESADRAKEGDMLADGWDGKGLIGAGLEIELQPVKRGRIQ